MKRWLPGITVFWGSFLLFGVQPMLGRTLLPSFGGTAAVWTTCLAAYQALLLAGYFYVHRMSVLPLACQRAWHTGLLLLSVAWAGAFAGFRPALAGWVGKSGTPALEVLFCVLVVIGLPYVLLSANSSLIQSWMSKSAGREVYRLYAVSNMGSFAGLLCYPFFLEPRVSLTAQWWGFAVCLAGYTALLFLLGMKFSKSSPQTVLVTDGTSACRTSELQNPGTSDIWFWFILPMASCFLLNAVTTHLSSDITPVPLLWVLFLGVFLLSYILGFSAFGERSASYWGVLAVAVIAGMVTVRRTDEAAAFAVHLPLGVAVVFFSGVFLHGWLYRLRPPVVALTRFYLGIAAGGAVGGLSASVLAPLLFSRVIEFPIAVLNVCLLVVIFFSGSLSPVHGTVRDAIRVLAGIAILLVGCHIAHASDGVLVSMRNFYGISTLVRSDVRSSFGDTLVATSLKHGHTTHGLQFQEAYLRDKPTTYYGALGGGLAISMHTNSTTAKPLRVGLIGLGAGTMALYGRTNDYFRFYEINPQVIALATNPVRFTFLSDAQAMIDIVLGDARKSLEREQREGAPAWDVLVLDAYSGDAIPLHLATREAFELYLSRLAPDGILAIHITNWHIDLSPLCKAVAKEYGLSIESAVSAPQAPLTFLAYWAFLSRVPLPSIQQVHKLDWENIPDIHLPSDEVGSLTELIHVNFDPRLKPVEIKIPDFL